MIPKPSKQREAIINSQIYSVKKIISLEKFGDIFLWSIFFDEIKRIAWVEATESQVLHYLNARNWSNLDQFTTCEVPPLVEFGKEPWSIFETNNEVWEVLPKGEIYENPHGLFSKDERFIWKNFGWAE